jgi:bifunctional ADP-heptose synthase (sugar kinase/adenylyltransferase)
VGGASVKEAAALANVAGGVVVGYVGIVPVEIPELIATTLRWMNNVPQTA